MTAQRYDNISTYNLFLHLFSRKMKNNFRRRIENPSALRSEEGEKDYYD